MLVSLAHVNEDGGLGLTRPKHLSREFPSGSQSHSRISCLCVCARVLFVYKTSEHIYIRYFWLMSLCYFRTEMRSLTRTAVYIHIHSQLYIHLIYTVSICHPFPFFICWAALRSLMRTAARRPSGPSRFGNRHNCRAAQRCELEYTSSYIYICVYIYIYMYMFTHVYSYTYMFVYT